MAGIVPAIHALLLKVLEKTRKTWMPGIKPGVTVERSAHDF
jgi:hypothetical protein